jgi:glycosyltransferase involved in cell wall biosynthesis
MSRVRVMHLVVAGDIGGAERLLVDLAGRPKETGADHEVALMTPNPNLHALLRDAGLAVHDRGPAKESALSYLIRSLGPADVAWLSALLADRRIDIVHTHTFGSHVLGTRAARRAGRKQVRTEHHVMHYFDPSCSPFTRWAAARTDRFVAVSEYVLRVLVRTAPAVAARTTVVRNGIDTAYWSPRPRPVVSGSPFRAAIVCRLTAWKRVDLAILAAAHADVELTVVGDGEERGRLEAVARQRGTRVRFVGQTPDPRPFIAECDATISTAKDEPLGLSVLESLAMERPVVACAGGGIPEIVQNEATGFLVDEATPAALAGAIQRAKEDRERLRLMGREGRRFVVEHGSVLRMCEGYAAVYRGLVGSA